MNADTRKTIGLATIRKNDETVIDGLQALIRYHNSEAEANQDKAAHIDAAYLLIMVKNKIKSGTY